MTSNVTNSTNHTNATSNVTAAAVAVVQYSFGEKFADMLIITAMAAVGGLFVQLFCGLDIPKFKCFPGLKTRPLLGKV
jgi:hypothetical protein